MADEAFRPVGVELHHPVAHDLQRHAADPRRLRARCTIMDRRQRQKPPRLRFILRSPGRCPHQLRVKIHPQWNSHGKPPSFAMVNHITADLKTPPRVRTSGIWYYPSLGSIPMRTPMTRSSTATFLSMCRPDCKPPLEPRSWI